MTSARTARALKYVGGYTIVSDVSARDWVTPALKAQGMINAIVAWEHNILRQAVSDLLPDGPGHRHGR